MKAVLFFVALSFFFALAAIARAVGGPKKPHVICPECGDPACRDDDCQGA